MYEVLYTLSGELCRGDSGQQNYVKACNIPSVILSAYFSTQRQPSVPPAAASNGLHRSVHEQSSPLLTGVATEAENTSMKPMQQAWAPLLLVVPLRLGLSKITPVYYNALKVNCDLKLLCVVLVLEYAM